MCKIYETFWRPDYLSNKLITWCLIIPTKNFQNKDFQQEQLREGMSSMLPISAKVQILWAGFKCFSWKMLRLPVVILVMVKVFKPGSNKSLQGL